MKIEFCDLLIRVTASNSYSGPQAEVDKYFLRVLLVEYAGDPKVFEKG